LTRNTCLAAERRSLGNRLAMPLGLDVAQSRPSASPQLTMTRSFDNVDFKVAEAEYFLEHLRARDCVEPEIDFLLSAYAAAARSITLSLKAVLGETDGFVEWYAVREARLRADPLARYFLELRNYTQKTGARVVNQIRSPEKLRELLVRQLSGRRTWFGESGEALPPAPDMEVGEAALAHFRTLLGIVYECYVDFGPVIDPQQHYTPEHYALLGKTVEDAEEELGFPRGWTSLGKTGPDDIPWRFELLRRHAAGEGGLNEIFARYLGKTPPQPVPLPERPLPENEGWTRLQDGSRVWIPKELRKTGTAEGDLADYIASLKAARGATPEAPSFEEQEFARLRRFITAAILQIPARCFEVPVAGAKELAIRERVFCYELYHHLRSAFDDAGFCYMLAGELDKGGHPIIRGNVIPDFVVHEPGDMSRNLCAIEVKPLSGATKGFRKDLATLTTFVRDYSYHRGILLVFGSSPKGDRALRRKLAKTPAELLAAGVHVLWAKAPGAVPVALR